MAEDNIESAIRNVAMKEITPTATPIAGDRKMNGALIMEACQKAADMVRDVHSMHESEGETLAQHLEQIGETFLKLCQQAARNVRELRIMPKEMAESTAQDLVQLGQSEYQRFNAVTSGLIAARDALLSIDDNKEAFNAANSPGDGPASSRPKRT